MMDPGWTGWQRTSLGLSAWSRRRISGGLGGARLEPVLPDLAVERAQSDAEHGGRAGLVAAGVAQGLRDQMPLGFLYGQARRQRLRAAGRGASLLAAQRIRQIR